MPVVPPTEEVVRAGFERAYVDQPIPPEAPRSGWPLALALVVVVALIALIGYLLATRGDEPISPLPSSTTRGTTAPATTARGVSPTSARATTTARPATTSSSSSSSSSTSTSSTSTTTLPIP